MNKNELRQFLLKTNLMKQELPNDKFSLEAIEPRLNSIIYDLKMLIAITRD
jgi:hypothetical protein